MRTIRTWSGLALTVGLACGVTLAGPQERQPLNKTWLTTDLQRAAHIQELFPPVDVTPGDDVTGDDK